MSELGVQGFRAERDAVLTLAKSLSADEWNAPSDCAGWAIRDVLAHMAATLHGVIDPAFMPDMSGGTEQGMEGPVEQRRALPVEEVVAEYETFSAQAAELFASVQAPPIGDNLLPMNDLGTHPMSMLPNIFLFDSYCHLRNDILAPNGSVARPEPPRDEQRLRPTVEWMLAGLPWMCREQFAGVLDRPLTLELDGPGGGTFTLAPGGPDGRPVVASGAEPHAAATVRSGDHDFVVWGTRRRPWRRFVQIDGDETYAGAVLDAVNII